MEKQSAVVTEKRKGSVQSMLATSMQVLGVHGMWRHRVKLTEPTQVATRSYTRRSWLVVFFDLKPQGKRDVPQRNAKERTP
jgi:hypothetical protein